MAPDGWAGQLPTIGQCWTKLLHLASMFCPCGVLSLQLRPQIYPIKLKLSSCFLQIQERDQHREPSAGNQEAAAGQQESISGQRKWQRLLLAENIFLKSIINTLNIKLGGTFRHYRTRAVKAITRKENILLNSNNIPEVPEIYIL